ncbi:MAG TPA: hypothetical protein VFB03_00760 [Candidatus Saccharimonadales bacterium]|nr:hypothetical protein [Candidatus Saccharimonadales bacterium]
MQNLKITRISIILLLALLFIVPVIFRAPMANAVCSSSQTHKDPDCQGTAPNTQFGNDCPSNATEQCLQNQPFIKDLQTIVDFLSGLVGIVVVGVIILGGIQYSMAGDNPQGLTAAKGRITNGLIALAVFLFLFGLIQWLIPGGVFG